MTLPGDPRPHPPALTGAMEQAAQDLARCMGADAGFCREVVAASLTAQAAPVRVQVAQLTGALPRPARWLLRVLNRAQRLAPGAWHGRTDREGRTDEWG